MFNKDTRCTRNHKCEDDCNKRGICVTEDNSHTPYCQCEDFYHGVTCEKESKESSNEDIIFGVYWKFTSPVYLKDEQVELTFESVTRNMKPQTTTDKK
ncbi:hypothetical protein J6590_041432 [Homalodisca vitripennis]|nr:hypothetical protein J6590_041432 [Homalodisca vitripennis]